jgi:hypothetical protein
LRSWNRWVCKMAKRREIYAGMYVIAFDVILAVAIGAQYGMRV